MDERPIDHARELQLCEETDLSDRLDIAAPAILPYLLEADCDIFADIYHQAALAANDLDAILSLERLKCAIYDFRIDNRRPWPPVKNVRPVRVVCLPREPTVVNALVRISRYGCNRACACSFESSDAAVKVKVGISMEPA
jgi:hypothetical protein